LTGGRKRFTLTEAEPSGEEVKKTPTGKLSCKKEAPAPTDLLSETNRGKDSAYRKRSVSNMEVERMREKTAGSEERRAHNRTQKGYGKEDTPKQPYWSVVGQVKEVKKGLRRRALDSILSEGRKGEGYNVRY